MNKLQYCTVQIKIRSCEGYCSESSFSFLGVNVREKLISVLTFIELNHIIRRSAALRDPRFARTEFE